MGNKIVVVGGRTAGTSAAEVTPTEVFDGTSWHDAAGIPVPGDHLAAASDGRYLYAVGGRRLAVTANTAAVQRFDPNADQWTQLPAVPGKVSDCGVAIVGGRLIVVGGESIGTVFNTVRAFDLTASTWSTCRPSPQPGTGWPSQRSATPSTPSTAQPNPDTTHPPAPYKSLAVPRGPLGLPGVGSWGVIRCTRSSRWARRCWMAGSGWPAV